jgi:hypothetical protein
MEVNFTFHDLRSYFVTAFKGKHGALAELHADPGTTARIYDSSRVIKRNSALRLDFPFWEIRAIRKHSALHKTERPD